MTLVRTTRDLFPSFNNLFDDLFTSELSDWRRNNFTIPNSSLPMANVKEDENGFIVEIAAPGMKKEDFNIQLDKNLLIISSEKKEEEKEENGKYARREFAYQSFQRTFTLPESADGENIKAKYENGILYLNIPKKEEAKPRPSKSISIS